MEYLNRKIKIKQKDTTQNVLRVDIIDGMRLSLRFYNDEDPDDDIVINFTKDETEKIKRVIQQTKHITSSICDNSADVGKANRLRDDKTADVHKNFEVPIICNKCKKECEWDDDGLCEDCGKKEYPGDSNE